MVKISAYMKTVRRTVKNNFGRFAAITAIILLGIAFVSGLGTLSPKILDSVSERLSQFSTADMTIKSTSPQGFTAQQIDAVNAEGGTALAFTAMDMTVAELNARVYVMPLQNMNVNRLELLEGRVPKRSGEILAERESDVIARREIGEKIQIMGTEAEVVGIAANPLTFIKEGEPDVINQQALQLIVYFDSEHFAAPLPKTDIYVRAANTATLGMFSDEYKSAVAAHKAVLETALGDTAKILTLDDNKSYVMLESYCQKIEVISLIFPIFFIAVAALVVLTTMTRLIEEERAAIGCYKTLGYSDGKIALKYVGFAILCCIVGSVLGIAAGVTLLPAVIYPAFNILFFMPPMIGSVNLLSGLIATVAMLAAVAGVTLYLILRELRVHPASLLMPKAPKAGKKIFLERIPFLWKHMSFKFKSTFRNIFRYVKHLIMTVISVAGSTALVLAGFGLMDISKSDEMTVTSANMAESFSQIALVVIIFAALLCILVIYNLTNMNIGERKREIATLKVLGYHDKEVAGYIYREVFIMALIGIAVGLPLGYGLLNFVFTYLDFGKIEYVSWLSYLLSGGMVVVFIGIVDILLHRKIKNIDMTSSLKTVE